MNKFLNNCRAYEIYPVSYCDSNGDGIGDINGIISKLDYLKDLGINLIWINPFFKGEFKDAGYDISDYYDIDPMFGSMQDVERLINEASKRGIKLLFDLVMGHTSDKHPWFLQAQKEKDNEYTDRYIWCKGIFHRGDVTYISGLSERPQGYAVNYYATQPALNYGFYHKKHSWEKRYTDPICIKNRQLVVDVIMFWLKKGVAGFRVDMAGEMVKRDNLRKTGNVAFWRDVFSKVKAEFPDSIFLGEWGQPKNALKRAGFDMCNLYLAELLEVYNTNVTDTKYFSTQGKGYFRNFLIVAKLFWHRMGKDAYSAIMPSCHDHGRMNHGQSMDMLKCTQVMMRTLPGVHFTYMGDEVAVKRQADLPTKDAGYDRTAARTPMQWNSSRNLGFSSADEDKIYLPTDGDPSHTVEAMQADSESLLNLIRKLNFMRCDYDCLFSKAKFKVLKAGLRGYPLMYKREGKDYVAIVAFSPTDFGAKLKNKYFNIEPVQKVLLNAKMEKGILQMGKQAAALLIYKK